MRKLISPVSPVAVVNAKGHVSGAYGDLSGAYDDLSGTYGGVCDL